MDFALRADMSQRPDLVIRELLTEDVIDAAERSEAFEVIADKRRRGAMSAPVGQG